MEVKVSTGVVFGIKDIPIWAMRTINENMRKQMPEVPIVHLEDKGRDEPNPNDPNYQKAMSEWEDALSMKFVEAAILLGIEIKTVPEGFHMPDSSGWSEDLELLGIEVPADGKERFISWVKLYAAPTLDDIGKITMACASNLGVSEEDVAQAAAIFQGREGRGADRGTLRQTRRKS